MKKIKIMCLVMAMVLGMQATAFAADTKASAESVSEVQATSIQPRGMYLQGGECSITGHSGYVTVSGHTDSFDDADEVTIKLTVYQQVASGAWVSVWSDSITEYDTFHASYPLTDVWVEEGYYYMVEAKHTVKHNGVTESNYSETDGVYCYY